MKVEIRIGDTSSGKRVKYEFEKYDDIEKEKARMYEFLAYSNDCVIEDVDNFLLFALNIGFLAFVVKDNVESEGGDDQFDLVPKFNPEVYRAFEVKEDGQELSLQNEQGMLDKNYFNCLMESVLDDYYLGLNYF